MERGGARLLLDATETELLRRLTGELRALLARGRPDRDPVLDRLFPDAYEDAANEAAYQELVGDDLTKHKLAALDTVSTSLGRKKSDVAIEGDDIHAWLACLTDLRLAIGTRLDVDEDRMAADIDPRDPDAQSLAILHWLGWVQESLLRTIADL